MKEAISAKVVQIPSPEHSSRQASQCGLIRRATLFQDSVAESEGFYCGLPAFHCATLIDVTLTPAEYLICHEMTANEMLTNMCVVAGSVV